MLRLLNAQRLLTWRQMSAKRMLMWRQMDAKRMLTWRLLDAQNYEDLNYFCLFRGEGVKIRFFYSYRGGQGPKSSIYQKFLSSDRVPLSSCLQIGAFLIHTLLGKVTRGLKIKKTSTGAISSGRTMQIWYFMLFLLFLCNLSVVCQFDVVFFSLMCLFYMSSLII